MTGDTQLRILCYDISDDRRRRRVAKLMEDEASRVQWSVFEARMTDARLRSLTGRVQPLLGPGDSLRVYTIGRSGERHCNVLGSGAPIETDGGYWLL